MRVRVWADDVKIYNVWITRVAYPFFYDNILGTRKSDSKEVKNTKAREKRQVTKQLQEHLDSGICALATDTSFVPHWPPSFIPEVSPDVLNDMKLNVIDMKRDANSEDENFKSDSDNDGDTDMKFNDIDKDENNIIEEIKSDDNVETDVETGTDIEMNESDLKSCELDMPHYHEVGVKGSKRVKKIPILHKNDMIILLVDKKAAFTNELIWVAKVLRITDIRYLVRWYSIKGTGDWDTGVYLPAVNDDGSPYTRVISRKSAILACAKNLLTDKHKIKKDVKLSIERDKRFKGVFPSLHSK